MSCNECENNNNGWCKRYKLQKPQAIKVCDYKEEMEDFKKITNSNTYNKLNKEIKIRDNLVVKNEFRYFDIVEVLDIFKSNSNGQLIYEVQSIAFTEKRIICFDYILGILDVIEGVNIYDYITEKRK